MGGCSSCCSNRSMGRRSSAHLVGASPRKKSSQLSPNNAYNPLQDELKKNAPVVNGSVIGTPLLPIWALQILPTPSFLKESDNSVPDTEPEALAIVVIEEQADETPPLESDQDLDDLDFELPELMGPAGDQVLETKGTSMMLSPTKLEIIEIERQLSNTPLPEESDDEAEVANDKAAAEDSNENAEESATPQPPAADIKTEESIEVTSSADKDLVLAKTDQASAAFEQAPEDPDEMKESEL